MLLKLHAAFLARPRKNKEIKIFCPLVHVYHNHPPLNILHSQHWAQCINIDYDVDTHLITSSFCVDGSDMWDHIVLYYFTRADACLVPRLPLPILGFAKENQSGGCV